MHTWRKENEFDNNVEKNSKWALSKTRKREEIGERRKTRVGGLEKKTEPCRKLSWCVITLCISRCNMHCTAGSSWWTSRTCIHSAMNVAPSFVVQTANRHASERKAKMDHWCQTEMKCLAMGLRRQISLSFFLLIPNEVTVNERDCSEWPNLCKLLKDMLWHGLWRAVDGGYLGGAKLTEAMLEEKAGKEKGKMTTI